MNVVVYEVEAALAPFGPRPHWGGFFLFRPEVVATMYPMMTAYREAIEKLDPTGKFRNSFVDQFVFGIAAAEEETTPPLLLWPVAGQQASGEPPLGRRGQCIHMSMYSHICHII